MIDIIQQRLRSYNATNAFQEEQAAKEIIQEIALYALWRCGFFDIAAFQGGTSLRILHGLPRFSEDLDFMLKNPDPDFDWNHHLGALLTCFEDFGLKSEALSKGKMDQRIKKAVIKDNSISNQLNLSFYQGHADQKFNIKLEIDVLPPAGAVYQYSYLDFPADHEVCHQDLASNFALKIHALLCRPYLKGRDWYDFNWYVKQGVKPNLGHLYHALLQYGPWQGVENLVVNENWLRTALQEKIDSIDWKAAADDVQRFLPTTEQASLTLWSVRFFSQKLGKLIDE